MASRSFLLLALAFAVVLLITSQVAAAKEVASENDSEMMNDNGHGGYSKGGGGHGGHDGGHGGHGGHGGRGGHGGGHGGADNGGGHKGCKYGCCGGGRYNKGCKCCSTFEEATTYKQTQN